MPQSDPQRYADVQDAIASGEWVVDAEQGHLYSPRRYGTRPIGGVNTPGYLVTARKRGQLVYVHRIIWESLHGPIPQGLVVNHIDGDKLNNRIDNLEVVTDLENVRHSIRTGLRRHGGTHCIRGHEFTPENTKHNRKRGWRYCRTCLNEGRRKAA